MDEKGRRILALLCVEIKKMMPGRPETYLSCKDVHGMLGLKNHGSTWGLSLRSQGLDSLANWLQDKNLPAITGVIIDRTSMEPGHGFPYPITENKYKWWEDQVRKAKEFDWSDYVADSSKTVNENWSDDELLAAIKIYFKMLAHEKAGEDYNKAEFNRLLREGTLVNRTENAVEFRMQNISAVLAELSQDWFVNLPFLVPRNIL